MVAKMKNMTVQKQFSIESDIPYIDFQSRSCANLDLDPTTTKLGYKIMGIDGPRALPSFLGSENDFSLAMTCICALISRAQSKEYGIEIC